jgi:hypothetical protein
VGQIEVSATPLFSWWNTLAYRLCGPAYPADGTLITRQTVASSYVKAGVLVRSRERHGQWLERAGVRDALMRPVPVVELPELPQDVQEVQEAGLVPDQRAVQ